MANLMPKSCAVPTCAGTTSTRYCHAHAFLSSGASRIDRGTTTEQGYGTVWQKVRKHHLLEHPLCELCKQAGKVKAAREVHHIKPINQGGGNENSNLQSLCKSCHSAISGSSYKRV